MLSNYRFQNKRIGVIPTDLVRKKTNVTRELSIVDYRLILFLVSI